MIKRIDKRERKKERGKRGKKIEHHIFLPQATFSCQSGFEYI
jgi:hypothetical protein